MPRFIFHIQVHRHLKVRNFINVYVFGKPSSAARFSQNISAVSFAIRDHNIGPS
jgi:hypothetical protein